MIKLQIFVDTDNTSTLNNFEGKIIRQINITTLDPFGYSIADTGMSPQGGMIAHANQMHIKSRELSIRNLLLIHRNQEFDSLLVKESERLVRSKGYIHDVSFFVIPASAGSDSVDINIREMDNWSLVPRFSASTSNLNFALNDKNFAGLGHDSQNSFSWYPSRHVYLTLQTQSYSPWYLWGFHFGPFLGLAIGVLGNEETGFKNNRVYSDISLGVLIRNDNLVISTFQFSVSYYPSIPGTGQNIFKANTLRTSDFGFRDFEIGKPGIMLFQ